MRAEPMAAAALLILPTLAAPSTALDAFLYSPLFGPLLPVGANPSLQWQGVRVDPKDVCANNASVAAAASGKLLVYTCPVPGDCTPDQLYMNAFGAGAAALLVVEPAGAGCGKCGNGIPSHSALSSHEVPLHRPMPWLATPWVGDETMAAITSGTVAITVYDPTARLLEQGWAEAFLRWIPSMPSSPSAPASSSRVGTPVAA